MSNRLKRRLNDLGIDVSSSKANESFCLIGTPLPPLEKSKDLGEFVPLWKQEVRDEKGRRRLHGAFTGGFSAGYFNTVGSKEGWTPSTFVSSRGDRAKAKVVRPEDFMDEEDLQELRESRMLVDTTEEMDLTAGTAAELRRRADTVDTEQDSIINTLQATLLPSPTDSVGARILKGMGWKPGHGIGPRLSFRQRKLQDLQASSPYGTRAVIDDVKITEEDEEASKHTYPRRDTPVLIVENKDNAHGLGYRPGLTLHETLGSASQAGSNAARIAAGFGLGALNDADEDDLDIYDNDLPSKRNRLAFDERHQDETIMVGVRRDEMKAKTVPAGSSISNFRDGSRVLPGFILGEKPVSEDRWFPFPDIPPGWKPNPRRIMENNKENIPRKGVTSEPLPYAKWKSSGMTADERGAMLGETPLDTGPRSVFDYLSEKDRERLKMIATATAAGIPVTTATISIPRLEPQVAQAALKGFQPFTSDPERQARYTAYLRSQAVLDGSTPSLQQLPNQTPDEFQKELDDYAKAATIFKPTSGAMAGRFTSAAVVEQGPVIREGLHKPTTSELDEFEEKRKKEEEEKLSPQARAAKLGMYGPMTRVVQPWQPARLLCKRFGLKEPEVNPDLHDASESSSRAAFTKSEAEETLQKVATRETQQSQTLRDLSNIGLGEDETQGRDTLTYQRPAMDVFKAIFASDEEESDSENDVDVQDVTNGEGASSSTAMPSAMPSTITTTPPTNLLDQSPVDLSSFKPTFIPREGKAKKANDQERSKGKKEKKEKRKREKKAAVSFEVDEDGVEGLSLKPTQERPKKKKKKDKEKHEDDEDEGMWVEKPAPDIVKDMQIPPLSGSNIADENDSAATLSTGAQKIRKRAIDFM